jgi:hypothetical protein
MGLMESAHFLYGDRGMTRRLGFCSTHEFGELANCNCDPGLPWFPNLIGPTATV